MIETLILGTLAVIAAAIIGYFVGNMTASELFVKKYGWNIVCWQGHSADKYFVAAQKKGCTTVLAFNSDGSIDFDYNIERDGEQR